MPASASEEEGNEADEADDDDDVDDGDDADAAAAAAWCRAALVAEKERASSSALAFNNVGGGGATGTVKADDEADEVG